jgi:hypothetical protein
MGKRIGLSRHEKILSYCNGLIKNYDLDVKINYKKFISETAFNLGVHLYEIEEVMIILEGMELIDFDSERRFFIKISNLYRTGKNDLNDEINNILNSKPVLDDEDKKTIKKE